MVNQMRKESFDRAKKVKLIILDVDGTLTDGGIYIGESGELFKPFNCRDGFGIALAKRSGIEIAIITGRSSKQLEIRARELNITAIWQGDLDKRASYIELKKTFNLSDEEIAYIGDDILDLPIMMQVGFTGAVANAVTEVKTRCCVVSDFNGGEGAVREIIEFILKAKGLWQNIVAEFLDTEIKPEKEPFYMAANKSGQAVKPPIMQAARPAQSPLPQRPAQPVQPAQPPRIVPTAATTPQPAQPVRTDSTMQTRPASPVQPARPAAAPIRPAQPTQPAPSAQAARPTQPIKDNNLEKLDQMGKKLNLKF